jgi:hypothetical protein
MNKHKQPLGLVQFKNRVCHERNKRDISQCLHIGVTNAVGHVYAAYTYYESRKALRQEARAWEWVVRSQKHD